VFWVKEFRINVFRCKEVSADDEDFSGNISEERESSKRKLDINGSTHLDEGGLVASTFPNS